MSIFHYKKDLVDNLLVYLRKKYFIKKFSWLDIRQFALSYI